MHLQPGTLLQGGKYRIVRFIAAGGFGCTYEALHVALKKRVAIKEFFVSDFCNRDSTGRVSVATDSKRDLVSKLKRKFYDEACAVASLDHTGIVHVSDVFEENGTAYFVMDYIDGRSLAEIVKAEGPMSEARALGYIRQVCAALHYVHSQNRLHLDIKPNNIMVTGNDRAILIDFGVSKQYDEASGENTSTLLGCTPGYAPPEQMSQNIKHFYPATDIYSLGATLYDLLTGEAPPDAAKRTSEEEELQPLSQAISASTRAAVYAALELSKKKRPQSVAAFAAMLDSGVAPRPAPKPKPAPAPKPKDNGETHPLDEVKPIKPTAPWYKRYPAVIAIAAVVAIAGIIAMLSGGNAEPEYIDEDTIASIVELGDTAVATIDVSEYTPQEPVPTPAPTPEPTPTPAPTPQPQPTRQPQPTPAPAPQPQFTVSGSINGRDYVDLGLSVKWATCNVGASSPSGYGDHYAWGETSTKTEYTSDNSRTYGKQMGSICGNSLYDVARYKWGSPWRLPSASEIDELLNNCTWEWTTMNGVAGYKVKSKRNSNYIFLPAAGWRNGSSLYLRGSSGCYWSGTPYESGSGSAYGLGFDSGGHGRGWDDRYHGRSVRPVAE